MATAMLTPDPNGDRFQSEEEELIVDTNYQFFIIGLALLQIVNSLLIVLLEEPQRSVIIVFFLLISLVLIADAVRRLVRFRRHRVLEHQIGFWLILLGSLPIPFIILVRLATSYRMLRNLQRQDIEAMGKVVVMRRAQSTLLIAIFFVIIVLELGSTLILGAEAKSTSANIVDANDAIWWALVTVATVGYGDQYPVATAGRLIAVLVMVAGVGLFTVLTSYFAHWFLRPQSSIDQPSDPGISHADYEALMNKLERLTARVEHLTAAQPVANDGADAPPGEPDT